MRLVNGKSGGSVAATTTEGVLVNPNGRQLPLEPTPELRELVERAAGLGLTRQQIAATIKNPATGKPIHQATLTDHFADEIDAGQARLITEVGSSLWQLALHGENERERRAACEFLLSRRGGPAWKEHQQVDVTTHVINNAHATLEAKLEKLAANATANAAIMAQPSPESDKAHLTPAVLPAPEKPPHRAW